MSTENYETAFSETGIMIWISSLSFETLGIALSDFKQKKHESILSIEEMITTTIMQEKTTVKTNLEKMETQKREPNKKEQVAHK